MSPRRVIFLLLFVPFYLLIQLVNIICAVIDEIIFPGYKVVDVRRPLFIVGVPRSGTTFMHRLFSEDRQFTATKTWELIWAPTVVQKLFWLGVGRLDQRLGAPMYRLSLFIELKLFAKSNQIHKTSFFEPEEDEFILLHTFDSATLYFLFPDRQALWKFCYFDERVCLKQRRKVMMYYKNCVKKHMYVFGRDKTYMTKNPAMCSKIRSLQEVFPDCRVIYLVRTPYQSVPSVINLFRHLFKQANGDGNTERIKSLGMEVASYFYDYPMKALSEYPQNQRQIVMFNDLVTAPLETTRKVYGTLGYNISAEFHRKLEIEEGNVGKAEKNRNDYSQYGITKSFINKNYAWVFEKYDLKMETD